MTDESELPVRPNPPPAAATNQIVAACDGMTTNQGQLLEQFVIVPALFSMLGHFAGHQILDLACGHGSLARRLAEHGAHVSAVDLSHEFLKFARTREAQEPRGIIYHFSDSSDMYMIEDSTFDEVVCHMALMEIENLPGTVAEVARVVKLGGRFIFSIIHPCFQGGAGEADCSPAQDYFEEGVRLNNRRRLSDEPQTIHRTLSTYINAVAGRGFTIRRISEPKPSQEVLAKHPELEAYSSFPVGLILEAVFPHV